MLFPFLFSVSYLDHITYNLVVPFHVPSLPLLPVHATCSVLIISLLLFSSSSSCLCHLFNPHHFTSPLLVLFFLSIPLVQSSSFHFSSSLPLLPVHATCSILFISLLLSLFFSFLFLLLHLPM